jgi:hypothetical protein
VRELSRRGNLKLEREWLEAFSRGKLPESEEPRCLKVSCSATGLLRVDAAKIISFFMGESSNV